ncbi:hypothetical protein [Fluviicola sp.]|uniref:hypothetical protein n=1 Tax=Fluviicola sp. TaxID=1917219 RepID=UPI0031D76861
MKYLLIVCTLFVGGISFSQDNIILKTGEEIPAKVLEIGTSEIKYKKTSNLEGPTYSVSKADVFMIKYENGTKEVINAPQSTEPKTSEAPKKETDEKPLNTGEKKSYIEKVRQIQSIDPGFSFYVGNAWLGGNGISKPVIGFDVRFPRKNVFVRGISVGARVSIAGTDNAAYDSGVYSEVFAYTVNVKYIAPIPVKVIQPYFSFMAGAAMRNHYNNYSYSGDFIGSDVIPVANVCIGSNFMFLRHFGAFVETGYFTTGYINTGFVLKIGKAAKRKSIQ